MAEQNLVVPAKKLVTLSSRPEKKLADSLQIINIRNFNDLAEHDLVRSPSILSAMLEAGQRVTEAALRSGGPFRPIPGRIRQDLGRFNAFVSAIPQVTYVESRTFWRVFRELEPAAIPDWKLGFTLPVAKLIITFKFKDITIEQGGTLEVDSTVDHIRCFDLLIKQGGSLKVNGSALFIKAHSIKGL